MSERRFGLYLLTELNKNLAGKFVKSIVAYADELNRNVFCFILVLGVIKQIVSEQFNPP